MMLPIWFGGLTLLVTGIVLVAALATGIRLLRSGGGRRGRQIVCSRCEYEIANREAMLVPCPECGADLLTPGGVVFGLRRRGYRHILLGVITVGAVLVCLLPLLGMLANSVNWQRLRPTQTVASGAASGDWEATIELARRLNADSLSEAELRDAVRGALSLGRGPGSYGNDVTRFVRGVIDGSVTSSRREIVLDETLDAIEQNPTLPYGTYGGPLAVAYADRSLPVETRERLLNAVLARFSDPAAVEIEGATRSIVSTLLGSKSDGSAASRLFDACIHPRLHVADTDSVCAGNTIWVWLDFGYGWGQSGRREIPIYNYISVSMRPIAESAGWSFAGDLFNPELRRQEALAQWQGAGFWVTLPDDPGSYTLSLELDAQVHDPRPRGSAGSRVWSYPDPAHLDQEPLQRVVRNVELALEVLPAKAGPPAPAAFEETWDVASGFGFSFRAAPFVWALPERGLVHVDLGFVNNWANLAFDVSILQAGVEYPIGWVFARKAQRNIIRMRSPAVVSARAPGVKAGLARLVLRPSFGPLRKPADFESWWAEEVVVPVEIYVPDAASWRDAYRAAGS